MCADAGVNKPGVLAVLVPYIIFDNDNKQLLPACVFIILHFYYSSRVYSLYL